MADRTALSCPPRPRSASRLGLPGRGDDDPARVVMRLQGLTCAVKRRVARLPPGIGVRSPLQGAQEGSARWEPREDDLPELVVGASDGVEQHWIVVAGAAPSLGPVGVVGHDLRLIARLDRVVVVGVAERAEVEGDANREVAASRRRRRGQVPEDQAVADALAVEQVVRGVAAAEAKAVEVLGASRASPTGRHELGALAAASNDGGRKEDDGHRTKARRKLIMETSPGLSICLLIK